MPARYSVEILGNTGSEMNKTGAKVKADSYYGYTDGIHTVAVNYSAFRGTLKIQGTLSLNPAETDWFTIREITKPVTGTTGVTLSEAYTFTGNYVYLRVILDKATLGDGSTYDAAYGAIGRVLLNN